MDARERGGGSDIDAAKNFARQTRGRPYEGRLDGRHGYRIWSDTQKLGAVICSRGDVQYSIGYSFDDPSALETFCENWRWLPLESPAKHVNLERTLVAFDRFSMRAPAWARLMKEPPPGKAVLVGQSHVSQRVNTVIRLSASMPAESQGVPLDRYSKQWGLALGEVTKVGAPINFRPLGQRVDRLISDTVKTPADGVKMTRVALIALDARERVVLQMDVLDADEATHEAYSTMLETIVSSIEPVEVPAR